MSSGGILIASEQVCGISVGAQVQMSIEWPFLLDYKIPLQLCADGWVLRRGACNFAVAFEKHQFRTRTSPSVG